MVYLQKHLSQNALMFILASTVGLLSGIAASILKKMIAAVSKFVTVDFHATELNWWLLVLPLVGIFLAGFFLRYILRRDIAHGVVKLTRDLKNKTYRLGGDLLYGPMLASTITLGFGGSAGSEGPIAYTGAAIGSNLGRLFNLTDDQLRILVGCGAAAGIAGIFKAPVGGALFTLEVLRMPLSSASVMMLLVTTLIASLTAYSLTGFTMDIAFFEHIPLEVDKLPYVALLGVFCGLYSLYYGYVMAHAGSYFDNIRWRWVKSLVTGIVLSVSVFLFPAMYGEGYGVIGDVINGDFVHIAQGSILNSVFSTRWGLVATAAGILLLKCFATSATTCGGVAGDFAPALFAGCVCGVFFASMLNLIFGLALPVGLFGLFGMAGVMAGAVYAPMMAIFLTVEMSAGYCYILPLALSGAISFGVVRLLSR